MLAGTSPSCSEEPAEGDPAAAEASSPAPIAVILGEPVESLPELLRTKARELGLSLGVNGSLGRGEVQLEQVASALDSGVDLLFLQPIAPDLLQRALTLAAQSKTPIVSILRSDGRSGHWIGVASGELAEETGRRAGRRLRGALPDVARIVVVEDGRWPESGRRADAVVAGIEAELGEARVMLRFRSLASPAETAAALQQGLRRMGRADVIVGGDGAASEAAWIASRQAAQEPAPWVVGVSHEAKLREAAAAEGSRLILAAWSVAAVVDSMFELAADAGALDPAAPALRPIACEVVEAAEVTKPGNGS
jgi:ABC-type sugar transport system substrate-binding protein